MATVRIFKWDVKKVHIERVIIIKVVVGVGMIAAIVLPGHIATWVGLATNFVWLTKL